MSSVIADSFTTDHHRCDRLPAATARALTAADRPGRALPERGAANAAQMPGGRR